jgi:hypothetical protein
MIRRSGSIFLVLILTVLSIVFAAGSFNVAGITLPLIEGAVDHGDLGIDNANVETFATGKPLAEVVAFYSAYFKDNGFLLIGGEEAGGFNASVKKGDSMFTVKIFAEKGKTILQFIW